MTIINNHMDLETRSKELYKKCNKMLKDPNNPKLQEEAAVIYNEIVALKTELEDAIKDSKSFFTRWKYKCLLNKVTSHEAIIYVIAEF